MRAEIKSENENESENESDSDRERVNKIEILLLQRLCSWIIFRIMFSKRDTRRHPPFIALSDSHCIWQPCLKVTHCHEGRDQKIRWSFRHSMQVTLDHPLFFTCYHITLHLISSHLISFHAMSVVSSVWGRIWSSMLHHCIPYIAMPYHIMPHHAVPYHAMPYHAMPYHAMQYHVMQYHVMLYHFYSLSHVKRWAQQSYIACYGIQYYYIMLLRCMFLSI